MLRLSDIISEKEVYYQVVLAFTYLRNKKYGTIAKCREYNIFCACFDEGKKVASSGKQTRRHAFSILAVSIPRSALPCPLSIAM